MATEVLLRRLTEGEIIEEMEKMIRNISEACVICKTRTTEPRRFKLTVCTDDLRFNHRVQIENMYLNERPVLRTTDLDTIFCSHLSEDGNGGETSEEQYNSVKSPVRMTTRSYQGRLGF